MSFLLPISRAAARPQLRTVPKSGIIRSRFNSSQSAPRGSWLSHTAAGLAGGTLVIVAGYGVYHYSGVKKIVDTSRGMISVLTQKRRSYTEKASSNRALIYLRGVAKSYVAIIPGADMLVDQAFDSVDEVVDAHGEEASAITGRAYEEVKSILARSHDQQSLETASQIMNIMRQLISELRILGGKVGENAMSPIWDHYPEIRETIGGGLMNLGNMVEDRGPGAKKVFTDVQQQAKNIFTRGSGDGGPDRARRFIRGKTSETSEEVDTSGDA